MNRPAMRLIGAVVACVALVVAGNPAPAGASDSKTAVGSTVQTVTATTSDGGTDAPAGDGSSGDDGLTGIDVGGPSGGITDGDGEAPDKGSTSGGGGTLPSPRCDLFNSNPLANIFDNKSATLSVGWNLPPGVSPFALISIDLLIDGERVGERAHRSAGQLAEEFFIPESDFDPYPDGHSLAPTSAVGLHEVRIWLSAAGKRCFDQMEFHILPPPMEVTATGSWVEGGSGHLEFHQLWPISVDNSFFTVLRAGFCGEIFGIPFCTGSTADTPEDFVSAHPVLQFGSFGFLTFPAGTQDLSAFVVFPDDNCLEETEQISLAWGYEENGTFIDVMLGSPNADFPILDDDGLPCEEQDLPAPGGGGPVGRVAQ